MSPARRVGIAALALAGIIALVLVWSPWSGESPGTDDTATSEASTHTSGEESGPPGGTSSTSPSPQSTSTSGSVEVGTVVTRVGQPCRFSDVGLRETTSGGVEVECRLGEDGAYSWERADS